ncbi:hypothetical protein ACTL6U_19570 [Rhodovibrionaceae bacterium A322]
MVRIAFHLLITVVLTLLTQLGGLAWLISLWFRRQAIVFILAYLVLSFSAYWLAPHFGRTAIACQSNTPLQIQSWLFCALNRHYVTPELHSALKDFAKDMEAKFPGTTTLVLDANFPFLDGFPLLPHLSHQDGRKVDIAFYYRDDKGYLPGRARSPIGYFAFEEGPEICPASWPTLRWDLAPLQNLWPNIEPDRERMIAALTWLSNDARIGKVFLEPHLQKRFGVHSPKLRFQGCKAARHDDHLHIQQ